MKASLHFNLPKEREEFNNAAKANEMKSLLFEISQEIFRPARKHGYSDPRMKKFLEEGGQLKPEIADAIGVLEEIFYELASESGINIHE